MRKRERFADSHFLNVVSTAIEKRGEKPTPFLITCEEQIRGYTCSTIRSRSVGAARGMFVACPATCLRLAKLLIAKPRSSQVAWRSNVDEKITRCAVITPSIQEPRLLLHDNMDVCSVWCDPSLTCCNGRKRKQMACWYRRTYPRSLALPATTGHFNFPCIRCLFALRPAPFRVALCPRSAHISFRYNIDASKRVTLL